MPTEPMTVTIPVSVFHRGVYRVGGRSKIAISLRELIQQSNDFSKKYTGGCFPKLVESNPKEMYLRYRVTCNKADSDPKGHDVKVRFAYEKINEGSRYDNLDVKVSCSCPAFLYWGAQWNTHKRDGLEGQPRPLLQAPTERLDLRQDYVICKHVHVVLQRVIPSVQRVINDKIRVKVVEENKRRMREEEQNPQDAAPATSPVHEPEYTQEDITPTDTPEKAPTPYPEDVPEYTMDDLEYEAPRTPEEKKHLPYDVDDAQTTRDKKVPFEDKTPGEAVEDAKAQAPAEEPPQTTEPVQDGQEADEATRQKTEEESRKTRRRKPGPLEGTIEAPPRARPNPDEPPTPKKKPRKPSPKPVREDLPRSRGRSGVIE